VITPHEVCIAHTKIGEAGDSRFLMCSSPAPRLQGTENVRSAYIQSPFKGAFDVDTRWNWNDLHLLGAGKNVQPQDSAHHGMNHRTNGPKGVPKTSSVTRFRQKI